MLEEPPSTYTSIRDRSQHRVINRLVIGIKDSGKLIANFKKMVQKKSNQFSSFPNSQPVKASRVGYDDIDASLGGFSSTFKADNFEKFQILPFLRQLLDKQKFL